ncbi:hypothetical protein SLE2022_346420 [Rubroshorea leprosula]
MGRNNATDMGEIIVEMAQPPNTAIRQMTSARNVENIDVMSALMSDQLVEIPLALGFGGVKQSTSQGNGAKRGRGKWKRVGCEVESLMHLDKLTQGKRKSSTAILEEQQANKVILNNTRVAMIP